MMMSQEYSRTLSAPSARDERGTVRSGLVHRFGHLRWLGPALVAAVLCATHAAGQNANPATGASGDLVYHVVALEELVLPEGGELPPVRGRVWQDIERSRAATPYAAVDGGEQAYFDFSRAGGFVDGRWRWGNLAVRAAAGSAVTGTVFLPDGDGGSTPHRFSIDASRKPAAAVEYYRVMQSHYVRLRDSDLPGASWFRHMARRAGDLVREHETEKDGGDDADEPATTRPPGRRGNAAGEVADTYELLTGTRALSENLQLDRVLGPAAAEDATIGIDSIKGITVRSFDWKARTEGKNPQLDALARHVPEDQHAVFFPSFSALVGMLDEMATQGVPVLQLIEPHSEDAHTRERYETQLGLRLTTMARAVGDQVIREIAMTGSDPYLRSGSDVAVLFRTDNATVLESYLAGVQKVMAGSRAEVWTGSGEIEGLAYHGVATPDRSLSSYRMRLADDVIAVTNSKGQLYRLAAAATGKHAALADSLEYRYLRDRYSIGTGDGTESAFIMLTDATIRRWCSPAWRIGSSRRTRAAAILAELEASRIASSSDAVAIPSELISKDMGDIVVGKGRPSSSVYGHLGFLTPIAELGIDKVTKSESDAYERWRDGYERNWQVFDPVAIRLGIQQSRVTADITVMPLILNSSYRNYLDIVRGGKLADDAGDRHDEALYQLIFAVDPESRQLRSFEGFARAFMPGSTSPLSWIGGDLTFYVDDDPVWDKLAATEDYDDFVDENLSDLPLAVRIASKSTLKMAAFFAGLRVFVQQAAPNLTIWESFEHAGSTYVKISATEEAEDLGEFEELSLFYVTLADGVTFSLREDVIRRAIDRRVARKAAGGEVDADAVSPTAAGVAPLLGESVSLQVTERGVDVVRRVFDSSARNRLRIRSHAAIPILNEWQRRFGGGDPAFDSVAFHDRHYGVRLVCPGGGAYVWNEAWETMESTVYGHPGKPLDGPSLPPAVRLYQRGEFGLTFEEDGLRARAGLDRKR